MPTSAGRAPIHLATSERRVLGGSAALAALAVAQAGVRVVVSGIVGDDPAGRAALKTLVAAGADVGATTIVSGRTWERIERRPPSASAALLEAVVAGDVFGRLDADLADDVLVRPGVAALLAGGGVDPGPVDTWWDRTRAAVRSCRPGDVLLLDGLTLGARPDLVDLAYDADLQIVADLRPFPNSGAAGALDPLERVDIAVVDADGAGLLADSIHAPASLVVLAGAGGATWDGLQLVPPVDPWAPPSILACPQSAHHAFCGALGAALASGSDREEALDAGLAAWARAAAADDARPALPAGVEPS